MVGWHTALLKQSLDKIIPPGRLDLTCRAESNVEFSIGERPGRSKAKFDWARRAWIVGGCSNYDQVGGKSWATDLRQPEKVFETSVKTVG